MSLYLYQSYFNEKQKPQLDPAFIPWDNTANRTPHMREYPMWKNSTFKHQNEPEAYWAILSVKWMEKTNLEPAKFKQWILDNPGYDLYYIDPFYFTPEQYKSTWHQGEQWHPGIMRWHDLLVKKMFGLTTDKIRFTQDDFITANYYVGNAKFWVPWMKFLDRCLYAATEDEYMFNFLYNMGGMYNGAWVPNFPFVTERLVTTFTVINRESRCSMLGQPQFGEKLRILRYGK